MAGGPRKGDPVVSVGRIAGRASRNDKKGMPCESLVMLSTRGSLPGPVRFSSAHCKRSPRRTRSIVVQPSNSSTRPVEPRNIVEAETRRRPVSTASENFSWPMSD